MGIHVEHEPDVANTAHQALGLGWARTRPGAAPSIHWRWRSLLGATLAEPSGPCFYTGWHVQRADPTLWCTSAWHDNGFRDTAADPKRLLRTGFFPGLGWLLTRALYKGELCLAPRGLALGLGQGLALALTLTLTLNLTLTPTLALTLTLTLTLPRCPTSTSSRPRASSPPCSRLSCSSSTTAASASVRAPS